MKRKELSVKPFSNESLQQFHDYYIHRFLGPLAKEARNLEGKGDKRAEKLLKKILDVLMVVNKQIRKADKHADQVCPEFFYRIHEYVAKEYNGRFFGIHKDVGKVMPKLKYVKVPELNKHDFKEENFKSLLKDTKEEERKIVSFWEKEFPSLATVFKKPGKKNIKDIESALEKDVTSSIDRQEILISIGMLGLIGVSWIVTRTPPSSTFIARKLVDIMLHLPPALTM